MRLLDFSGEEDCRLIQRLLRERTPVSHRLGVARDTAVFAFNEVYRPIHYSPDLDLAVSMETGGETLRLFDVVASRIPALEEIVARVPSRVSGLELYFSPDRLDARLEAEKHRFNGDDHPMARGPFLPEETPFMLPRSART